MQLIWFNPEDKSYHAGARIDFEVQMSLSKLKNDFCILDKLEANEERLARKIVERLNMAYTVY